MHIALWIKQQIYIDGHGLGVMTHLKIQQITLHLFQIFLILNFV